MKTLIELNKFNDTLFFDEPHTYLLNGKDVGFTSTTTFIDQFFNSFPAKFIAPKSATKFNRENPWETPKTAEDIMAEWDFKRVHSTTEGNIIHDFCENIWGHKIIEDRESFFKEYNSFDSSFHELCGDISKTIPTLKEQATSFYEDHKSHLILVKAEFVIRDTTYGITGSIDALFYDTDDSKLHIYDWKTSANIDERLDKKGKLGKKMKAPFDDGKLFRDVEYWHYALQLSIYKHILLKNTNGLEVGDNRIVWFNEENENYTILSMSEMDVKEILEKQAIEFAKENK